MAAHRQSPGRGRDWFPVSIETVLGVQVDIPDDMAQPLGVVMVVKALDDTGEVVHYIAKSSDIHRVEAVGMLITASDEFRASLAELARDSE